MKKLLTTVAVLAFVLVCVGPVSAHADLLGDGTPGNPYQISTCSDLQAMKDNLSSSYIVMNDIDCSNTVSWNGGQGFVPIIDFTGSLDGQGHIITGLYVNNPYVGAPYYAYHYVGLFGIAYHSVIKNIGLENVNIIGVNGGAIGGLAGYNAGIIANSYVTGSVQGSYVVGGLVGYNVGGTITNSFATASVVDGADHGGGLVGSNQGGGTITNSYSTGSVAGSPPLGGLVSENISGATITDSYWDTQTSGMPSSYGGVGKTTAEMKQQATFENWDFASTWGIKEGVSYPYLRWQMHNEPPIFAPIGNKAVNEGQALQFVVSASDPNNDSFTLSAANLPAGATFDPATGIFAWTPTFAQAGVYTVTFSATDTGVPPLSASSSMTITVNNVPTPVEQAQNLVDVVTGYSFPKNIENSYLANLKKVGGFIENAQITPAINQLSAFINKVGQDYAKGSITLAQKNNLTNLAETLVASIHS